MEFIQHGFGAQVEASDTPAITTFTEPSGTRKKARTVSIKNKGTATVFILINASEDATELANQFTNLTPLQIENGDGYDFIPLDDSSGAWYKNIAYVTASGTADLLINAY